MRGKIGIDHGSGRAQRHVDPVHRRNHRQLRHRVLVIERAGLIPARKGAQPRLAQIPEVLGLNPGPGRNICGQESGRVVMPNANHA